MKIPSLAKVLIVAMLLIGALFVVKLTQAQTLGDSGTIGSLPQWVPSSTPNAIFPRISGKNVGLYIMGSTQCLHVGANGVISGTGSDCSSGGGSGNVSTSSVPVIGRLAFWTSSGATPETLSSVATTSVTCSGGVSCNQFTVIGGSPITITNPAGVPLYSDWVVLLNGNLTSSSTYPLWAQSRLYASGTITTDKNLGSSASPGLYLDGDSSSGQIYVKTGDGELSFARDLTRIFSIDDDQLKLRVDGSISEPAIEFSTAGAGEATGFYHPSAKNLGVVVDTKEYMRFDGTNGVIVTNDSSNDVDTRIEGNSEANLLVTDGGLDRVGVATITPWTLFAVHGTSSGITLTSTGSATNTAASGWDLSSGCFSINGVCVGGGTTYTGTWPVAVIGSTISWAGLATSSELTAGRVVYSTGANTIADVATGTVSAGTGISVTAGRSVLGGGLTITNDGVTSLSGTFPIVNNQSTGAVILTCPTCLTSTGGSASRWATSTTDSSAIYSALASKVGIGTSSPYAALSVVGSTGVVADRYHATNSNATSTFAGKGVFGGNGMSSFGGIDSSAKFYIQNGNIQIDNTRGLLARDNTGVLQSIFAYTSDNNMDFANTAATGNLRFNNANAVGGIEFYAGNPNPLRGGINALGKFHVGTTSPWARLSVGNLSTDSYDALFAISSSTQSATTTHFVVKDTGKIGVSTTSPWGLFSIEQNTANPSFVVSNQGSTSPTFYIGGVNQNGYVGVKTDAPTDELDVNGAVRTRVQTLTIPDDGNGSTQSVGTFIATHSYGEVDCQDATNGCRISIDETNANQGQILNLVNISANNVIYADTGGVTELAGAYVSNQYDTIQLIYSSDRWIEYGRSDN